MSAVDPPRSYIALDLETTGLSHTADRIVEIGAVRFDHEGREQGRFERLVNPGRPMTPGAQAVNGISDAMLADEPPASVVLPAFLDFLADPPPSAILAHNARFDAAFLAHELDRLAPEFAPPPFTITDTLALARYRLPQLRTHRLDALAHALNLDPTGPHRALADSLRVKDLWLALKGDETDPSRLMTYRVELRVRPAGWDAIEEAIARALVVRIEYEGGTRGPNPREITPRAFDNRGGVAYLSAFCHVDRVEKQFRLDRVRRFEVLAPDGLGVTEN